MRLVNTRQHAKDLYTMLGEDEATFHLSTNLCPVHRKRELETIRQRLYAGQPCRVVSTQLGGIDVDFPAVYRALGPLEAVVQAAGRCNREGSLKDGTGRPKYGRVIVFLPEDHTLPAGNYGVHEKLAATMLKEEVNLHDPEVFTPYFRDVYRRVSQAPKVQVYTGEKPFQEAHAQLYFEQVARAYQMIEGEMLPVIIRGYHEENVNALLGTLEHSHDKRKRRDAWRALQGYTVNLYPNQAKKLAEYLSDVPELTERARRLGVDPLEIKQWPTTAKYDAKLGIVAEFSPEVFASF